MRTENDVSGNSVPRCCGSGVGFVVVIKCFSSLLTFIFDGFFFLPINFLFFLCSCKKMNMLT